MVRSELAKNPNIDNAALLEKARSIDPKVRRLSPRQFHATYRLPALRATTQRPAESRPAEPTKAASNKAESRTAATKTAARPATPPPPAAPAMPSAPATPAAPAAPVSAAPAPAAAAPAAPSPAAASPGKALARPHAAEREAVRAILQTLAREALGTEDRASFVRLLDSLDERANVILSIFGRH